MQMLVDTHGPCLIKIMHINLSQSSFASVNQIKIFHHIHRIVDLISDIANDLFDIHLGGSWIVDRGRIECMIPTS
jgi:hypothetical protein